MTATKCLAFLPKEIELIIYEYEHQLKMKPVLDDIKSLVHCGVCEEIHVCYCNCNKCEEYICEKCTVETNKEMLCEDCYEDRQIEQEELNDYYDFVYGDF